MPELSTNLFQPWRAQRTLSASHIQDHNEEMSTSLDAFQDTVESLWEIQKTLQNGVNRVRGEQSTNSANDKEMSFHKADGTVLNQNTMTSERKVGLMKNISTEDNVITGHDELPPEDVQAPSNICERYFDRSDISDSEMEMANFWERGHSQRKTVRQKKHQNILQWKK